MGLDDNVETARAHEAVGAREGEAQGGHHFGDADGGAAGDAHAAVDEGRGAGGFAFCLWEGGKWSVFWGCSSADWDRKRGGGVV